MSAMETIHSLPDLASAAPEPFRFLPARPYNNGVAAQSLAVTPANTFLYAGTTNGIYVYAINTNGSITVQNSGTAVAQDVVATAMQVDSTGGYLLAAGIGTSIGAQAIGIYQIDATTGLLTALTGSPLPFTPGRPPLRPW